MFVFVALFPYLFKELLWIYGYNNVHVSMMDGRLLPPEGLNQTADDDGVQSTLIWFSGVISIYDSNRLSAETWAKVAFSSIQFTE